MERDELEIQRERYRVFIEDVADGFFETDLKGNFTFFNNALCRIFGRGRDEIRHRNFRNFMDQANAEIALESFNRIYRTGKAQTGIKWEIKGKDGDNRIFETSANLIVDDGGQSVGFRGITRDVTDKYLAEQALRESERCVLDMYSASSRAEKRYRALLDFLPDPVYVLDLDSKVTYVNPAFVDTFGWPLAELEGHRIPFIPDSLKEETRQGTRRLFRKNVVHGIETRRMTRDQRLLEVVLDAAVFYEEGREPAGQVVVLRDITREKQAAGTNRALFRIARSLHRFRGLDERLEFIADEIRTILKVEGSMVVLIDEERKEFFFRTSAFGDAETGRKFKEVRFPLSKGAAGQVYRTGRPLIVSDYTQSEFHYPQVEMHTGFKTRNLLDVPLKMEDRTVGVLCAVNKIDRPFGEPDVELLEAIASMVALPLENARIHDQLNSSYEEVRQLNRAKGRMIDHLSHELKTPVSVLSASLALLRKRLAQHDAPGFDRILRRSQRSLERILQMQYQTEDILRERDTQTHRVLTVMLETCADELEALLEEQVADSTIAGSIRERIDALYSPRKEHFVSLRLDRFVDRQLKRLGPKFKHRTVRVSSRLEAVAPIQIPEDVILKILEGLLRNAVENTPDGGRVEVEVRAGDQGPQLIVADAGVGITADNQRLLLENVFSTTETSQYASRRPYDFNAGGRGVDLLRMKIFSERYGFKIRMISQRCRFIPREGDLCPGDIAACDHCRSDQDCLHSGGTRVIVSFSSTFNPSNGNTKG